MITNNVYVNFQCAHPQAVAMFVQFIRFAIALPAHLLAPPHPHPSSMCFYAHVFPWTASCRSGSFHFHYRNQLTPTPTLSPQARFAPVSRFSPPVAYSVIPNTHQRKGLPPQACRKTVPCSFTCYLQKAFEPRGFPFCAPESNSPRSGSFPRCVSPALSQQAKSVSFGKLTPVNSS
jgi:hypothetical protein